MSQNRIGHRELVQDTYANGVLTPRQQVDYALARRSLLDQVYAGRVGTTEVCDADPYLRQAAKFYGQSSDHICPICRKVSLTEVCWVYGDELKHAAGTARAPKDLDRLAQRFSEFTVYVVEVCLKCGWNHLVRSYVLGANDHGQHMSGKTTAR